MTRQALAAAVSALLAVALAPAGAAAPVSDLSITNNDFAVAYTAGSSTIYTIVVGNAGPDAVVDAIVSDLATSSAQVTGIVWTCVGAGGGSCTVGPVATDLVDTVDLPVGGTATYTLVVTLSPTAAGSLVNTATVTPPAGTTDPGPAANTATDTDAAATILYVATTGVDAATCGPLAAPCKTIQTAIDNANAGNTVVVAKGTYNECIVLVPGIGVGGVRVESDEHLASGTNAATILDGTGVCDAASPGPAPVAKVYDGSSLRGFSIKGGGDSGVLGLGAVSIVGNAITGNATTTTGGGVRLTTGLNLSDPLLKAEINGNTILSNTSGRDGAGIFVDASASGIPSLVDIRGNTVSGNTAGDGTAAAKGSGISVSTATASAADSSRVVIAGNTLDGNIAKNSTGDVTLAEGGGIFVATGAVGGAGTETITIGDAGSGNAIRNNVSYGLGGGMSIRVQPTPSGKHTVNVSANTVTSNTGKRGGGGAHLFVHAVDRIAGLAPDVVLRVAANSFIRNHAQGLLSDPNPVGGGGIYAELHSDRTPEAAVLYEISGNTIQGNDATTFGGGCSLLASADDDPASDGAIAPADAVISLHHNVVVQNAAHDTTAEGVSGGGVHALAVARGAAALARVSQDFLTVVDNQTELGSGGLEWEDLHVQDSLGSAGTTSFVLSNSIISGNDGFGVGGTIIPGPSTTVAITYNDSFDNGSGDYEAQLGVTPGTNGNISVDPELDALFLPRICGPMVDQGDPTIAATVEPQPNGGRVNLGHLGNTASATRTFPDVNGDGTIDGLDVLGIAVSFNSCSDLSCSDHARFFTAADRDLNQRVDGEDLAYVSAFFAQSCP